MKNFFITVVIPAYNEEKYLPACLAALQRQTYSADNFGILVVDNNSTDATADIARSFGAKVVMEKKQGYIYSLNRGLQEARGEIIAVTDSDTVVSKNWLEEIAIAFNDETVVGVTGRAKFNSRFEGLNSFSSFLYTLFLYVNFAFGKPHFAGPNLALRRSAYKKIKTIDDRFKISGDVELGFRLKKVGKVLFVRKLFVTVSARRFKGNFWPEFFKYSKAYFLVVWLRRPPREALVPVR